MASKDSPAQPTSGKDDAFKAPEGATPPKVNKPPGKPKEDKPAAVRGLVLKDDDKDVDLEAMCAIMSQRFTESKHNPSPVGLKLMSIKYKCLECKKECTTRCNRCNKAWYCSVACQRKNWGSSHKAVCSTKDQHHKERQPIEWVCKQERSTPQDFYGAGTKEENHDYYYMLDRANACDSLTSATVKYITPFLKAGCKRKLVLKGERVVGLKVLHLTMDGFPNPICHQIKMVTHELPHVIAIDKKGQGFHKVTVVETASGANWCVDLTAIQYGVTAYSPNGYPLLVEKMISGMMALSDYVVDAKIATVKKSQILDRLSMEGAAVMGVAAANGGILAGDTLKSVMAFIRREKMLEDDILESTTVMTPPPAVVPPPPPLPKAPEPNPSDPVHCIICRVPYRRRDTTENVTGPSRGHVCYHCVKDHNLCAVTTTTPASS